MKFRYFLSGIVGAAILSVCSPAFAEDVKGEVVDFDTENVEIRSMVPVENAKDGDFYNSVQTDLNSYAQKLESGEISEEEFTRLVEENVTPKLDTPEKAAAFEESEKKAEKKTFTASSASVEYALNLTGRLNSKESKLISNNASKGAKTISYAGTANSYTQLYWKKYVRWQGNGDAFRHAYWSALMTKNISRDWAYKFGYAHENLKTGQSTSDWDVKMDISNNYRGRKDGTNYDHLSNSKMATHVLKTVEQGKKVRIRTYTSGTASKYVDDVPTKYLGKYSETTNGGRH